MARIIELESCLNMSRADAEAIRDQDYPDGIVYLRDCHCRDCGGGGEALGHWYHPPWVIETTEEQ